MGQRRPRHLRRAGKTRFRHLLRLLRSGHAHTYFPRNLVRNSEEVPLAGNTGNPYAGQTFSHYRIFEESKQFIRATRTGLFFAYLAWTPPHGLHCMPHDDPSWRSTRTSRGRTTRRPTPRWSTSWTAKSVKSADLLKELGIAGKTFIFFTGDNGGSEYFADTDHPRGLVRPECGPDNRRRVPRRQRQFL